MKPITISNLFRKGLCTLAIAACMTLAGCQTTQTRSAMQAKHFDAADPCQSIRTRLVATQDHFSANIGGGIAIGIITGLVTGLQSGDRDKVMKHAIIGGLAGAAAGYLKGKLERAQSRAELRDAINSDVQRDTQKVTEMGSILRNLNECRQSQVAVVKQNFDDGSVTPKQTKAVLQTVRASVQGDNALIQEILGEVTERKGVYVASISHVEDKAEEVILADAGASSSETAADPNAVTDVRELDRASQEVRDEYEMASADLFQQIEEMEELTLV